VERFVVDASVAVKWFVTERGTESALKLMDGYLAGRFELLAPTLIYYEVANALRLHPYYRLTLDELFKAIKLLRDLQITVEPTSEMWSRCFGISLTTGLSVYDGIYAAMAAALDSPLVTADRKLIAKLGETAGPKVILLSEFEE